MTDGPGTIAYAPAPNGAAEAQHDNRDPVALQQGGTFEFA